MQILHEKAGGKKKGVPTPEGAQFGGVKSFYATTDVSQLQANEYDGAAGLTSKQIFHLDSHIEAPRWVNGRTQNTARPAEAPACLIARRGRILRADFPSALHKCASRRPTERAP